MRALCSLKPESWLMARGKGGGGKEEWKEEADVHARRAAAHKITAFPLFCMAAITFFGAYTAFSAVIACMAPLRIRSRHWW